MEKAFGLVERKEQSKLSYSVEVLPKNLTDKTDAPNLRTANTEMRCADTPLYSKGLVNRKFEVPGYGTAKGGEINYIGVGMMMAHYGLPFASVPVLFTGWNGYQMLKGEGMHNYNQIFNGSFWAGYG